MKHDIVNMAYILFHGPSSMESMLAVYHLCMHNAQHYLRAMKHEITNYPMLSIWIWMINYHPTVLAFILDFGQKHVLDNMGDVEQFSIWCANILYNNLVKYLTMIYNLI